MSVSVHEILDYLDAHLVRNHKGSATTLLKMLYELYTAYNTRQPVQIDGIEIRGEELAFTQGILVGMHLMTEINILP